MTVAAELDFLDPTRRLPLADEVLRRDLLERLHDRFRVPLVTIEAPAGFGKSTLVSQAIDTNVDAPVGHDVSVHCRSEDRDGIRLASRILRALAASDDQHLPADVESLASRICASLATLAPAEIVLIIDDVHHVAAGESATALTTEVMAALPRNAHLVLVGRQLPTLPLARLRAASQVIEVTQDDLAFSAAELEALADHHGLGAGAVDPTTSWPALARLTLTAGHAAAMDFLWEEVVSGIEPKLQRTVAALVMAGEIDTTSLAALSGEEVDEDELAALPMIDELADGSLRAHDLWADAINPLTDDERLDLLGRVVPWLVDGNRIEGALRVCARNAAWELAGEAVTRALRHGTSLIDIHRAEAWLATFPDDQHDAPAVELLRSAHRRLAGDVAGALELAEDAAARFCEVGQRANEAVALGEIVNCHWASGNRAALLDIYPRARELDEEGIGRLRLFITVVEMTLADLEGDPARTLQLTEDLDLASADPAMVTMIERWRASLLVLTGRSDEAVQAAERMLASGSISRAPALRTALAVTRWQHGDPEEALAMGPPAVGHLLPGREGFVAAAHSQVMGASIGVDLEADLAELRKRSSGHGRDQALVAVTAASQHVTRGEDDFAAAVFASLIDDRGVDDRLMMLEIGRFLPLAYVLSPVLRRALDDDDIGDFHPRRRAVARALLASRDGRDASTEPVAPPPLVLTSLPLRWSIELTLRAVDRPWAMELASYLSDVVTDAFWNLLPEVAAGQGLEAEAVALSKQVPRPPATSTEIRLLGPLTVLRHGQPADPPQLRRQRVRQLLSLLALRPQLRREQILALLWPDMAPDSSQNNLRVNLSHLRRLLEPDRAAGAPMFLLTEHGGRIGLRTGSALVVDAANLHADLEVAGRLAQTGDLEEAAATYATIAEGWTAEAFADLRHVDELRADLEEVDRLLVEASCRAGELSIASGHPRQARRAVAPALRHDPALERAHRVEVAAHIAEGDHAAAEAALRRCIDAVADLGLRPSADTLMLRRRLRDDRAPGAA